MQLDKPQYTLGQFAEVVGCHRNTIKNHIKAGLLLVRRTKPVTGHIRIARRDAEKYLSLTQFGGEAL
jgi:predicted site-specific integrase-resolvase